MFNKIVQGRRLTKEDQISGSIPFVMAGITNTGVVNYISNPVTSFPKNSITIDIFGNTFYRNYAFGAGDDTGVYWNNEKNYSQSVMLFFSIAIQKSLSGKFSYGKKLRSSQSLNLKIQLPVKNNKIDFEFMEGFIAELEVERLSELEAYLNISGLKDYILTKEEEEILDNYKNIEWGEFKLEVLFEKIKTKKLSFKADELPKQMIGEYTLPCLTSSFQNQGLNYFVPKDEATILKNVISIPSNSDIYRAYFQSNEFTVLSDAYAIRWIFDGIKLLPSQYLFAVQCINKVTDLPIYSYKNKLGGWNVVKNKCVQLPIKNDIPDYEIMKTLISAIQKLVIKELVLYTDKKQTVITI